MGKKVLVCGASGFIGRNIFETLSRRADLAVFGTYNRRKFSASPNLIQADLTDKQQVAEVTRGFDVLIQAAAVTSGSKDTTLQPQIHIAPNIIMNTLLCEAAYENQIPQMIFLSCTVIYPTDTGRAIKENDLNLNEEVHKNYFGGAWVKVGAEKLCEFYSRLGRTKFTVIRHSNIYGPYDKYDLERSHVLGATLTKVMTAKDKIVVWGDGREARDFLYVSDQVKFIETVIDKQDYDFDIFNIGSGSSISVGELVKKIVKIAGRDLRIEYDHTKPTIPVSLTIDISKAKVKFGWQPEITLEEGVKKTLAWYREYYPHQG